MGRDLTQPDDVRQAAQELVRDGKAKRVVVSLGPQGALGVDEEVRTGGLPQPVKKSSTVSAGDVWSGP